MDAENGVRPASNAMDALLGMVRPVLDQGFVRVVDYMGTDESIVEAARVSYGTGTRRIHEDRGLIRYLLRHGHTTPFEMCELKLHVRVPMDTWRQWIRHRTANVNEYSTRYSVAIDAMQKTNASEWRVQSNANRQGSGDCLDESVGQGLSAAERVFQEEARRLYAERLERGVAREQARKDLPLSTYTEAYWKCDLHNLLHFLELRLDQHAQIEIRKYAQIIADVVATWCPLTWEAFQEYRLGAVTFSAAELQLLARSLSGQVTAAGIEAALESRSPRLTAREKREFEEKLRRLGWQEQSG